MEPKGFDALIEAFTIFKKYDNPEFPTHCEHDELIIMVDPRTVLSHDLDRLEELGFRINHDNEETFISYLYGSA